jgi:hypothetical protein
MNGLCYAELHKFNEGSRQRNLSVYLTDLKGARVFVSEIHTDSKHASDDDTKGRKLPLNSCQPPQNTTKLSTQNNTFQNTNAFSESHSLFNTIIHFQCTNTSHPKKTRTVHADSSRPTGRTVIQVSAPPHNNLLAEWHFVQHSLYYLPSLPNQPHTTHILLSLLSPNISRVSTNKINSDLISMYNMPLCTAERTLQGDTSMHFKQKLQ